MTVGDRIRKRREELSMSQTDLAEKIKSSKQTLYKYENNIVTNIPYEKLLSISNALEVSPAYLMGWEIPKKDSATLLADIAGDPELIIYLEKIKEMNSKERQKVYDYIDFIVYSKKAGD